MTKQISSLKNEYSGFHLMWAPVDIGTYVGNIYLL